MSFWVITAGFLGVLGVALLLTGAARRNRGNTRLCPRCRYDLSATKAPPCSECGFVWTSDDQLVSRPVVRLRCIAGVISLALALAVVVTLPLLTGRDWTYFAPRPAISFALSVLVADQPVPTGSKLPAPNALFRFSKNRWERLVWQQQASVGVKQFLELVEQSNGSLDEIERLIPAAIEAQEILQQHASTLVEDAWPMRPVIEGARSRQAVLDARSALPLGTWAAAELQYYSGDSDQWRDWITPLLEILEPLSYSTDASIRGYVIDRIALVGTAEASAILERLAGDPDPCVQTKAATTLRWRRDIRGWK